MNENNTNYTPDSTTAAIIAMNNSNKLTIKATFGEEKRRFQEEVKNTLYESILIKISSLFNIVDFQICCQDTIITNSQQLLDLIQHSSNDIIYITIVNENGVITPRTEVVHHHEHQHSNEEEEEEEEDDTAEDYDDTYSENEEDEEEAEEDFDTNYSSSSPGVSPAPSSPLTSYSPSTTINHFQQSYNGNSSVLQKSIYDPALVIRHLSPIVNRREAPVMTIKHRLRLFKLENHAKKRQMQMDYKQGSIRLRLQYTKPMSKLDVKLRQKLHELEQKDEEQRAEIDKQFQLLDSKFEREQEQLEEKRKKSSVDDVILTSRNMWPNSIIRVIIHGDDMLLNTKPLNHYVKRNRDTGEQALIDSLYSFHKRMFGVLVTVLIFDQTKYVMQKVGTAEQNRHFIVASARLQNKTVDALFIEQSKNVADRERCLFVTSKRDLRQKLKFVNCKCVHPVKFFQFLYTLLDDEGRDVRQWLEEEYIIDTPSVLDTADSSVY
jgi:uncharacterized lipoprotein YmbA